MTRTLVPSGSPYEPIIGFSRAVRVGDSISIGGTAPIGVDGKTVAVGDAAGQARRCYEIIGKALAEAGASFDDVVRTRTMLTNIANWEAVGKVRGEIFKDIRPVDTMVEVTRFIDPEWLLEIEVDAVVHSRGG